MRRMTEDDLTDEVVDRLGATSHARLLEVMSALVRHLHAFAKEVRLTEEEWLAGVAVPHRGRAAVRRLAAGGHLAV